MVEKNQYHALFCFVDTVLKIIRAVFYVEKRKGKITEYQNTRIG